jgi:hypothetical protein
MTCVGRNVSIGRAAEGPQMPKVTKVDFSTNQLLVVTCLIPVYSHRKSLSAEPGMSPAPVANHFASVTVFPELISVWYGQHGVDVATRLGTFTCI